MQSTLTAIRHYPSSLACSLLYIHTIQECIEYLKMINTKQPQAGDELAFLISSLCLLYQYCLGVSMILFLWSFDILGFKKLRTEILTNTNISVSKEIIGPIQLSIGPILLFEESCVVMNLPF
jgi:hypothetical protein